MCAFLFNNIDIVFYRSSNTISRRGVNLKVKAIANRNISSTHSNGPSVDHVMSEPYNTLSENVSPAMRMMTLNQKSTIDDNSNATAVDDVCNLPMTDF